jgi:LacI family transcriptional regulator
MTAPFATSSSTPLRPAAGHSKRIALLIDTATSWGSGLIEGVANYAKARGKRWLFTFEPRGKYDRLLLPDTWNGDGVIARITHSALAEQLIARHIPAVNVSWFRYGENLIRTCTCDETQTAALAVQYFLDNGYRQFAYCRSTLRPSYYDRLGSAFVEQIEQCGYPCPQFAPDEAFHLLDGQSQLDALSEWVQQLPRPTALLTFDSLQGRLVTETCALASISVPDDIAVLGGEHDELCSRVSSPPLSGIDHAPQHVGYRAAEMLDRLMAGRDDVRDLRLPPGRIIARQSTDKIAVEDDLIAEAIRYIQLHFASHLRIGDILDAIPLSRRALEIGFRHHLGRTPRDEIRRVRVQKAVEMLCDTDLSIAQIATACGFERSELLTRAFRREFKSTPTDFRRRTAIRVSRLSNNSPS